MALARNLEDQNFLFQLLNNDIENDAYNASLLQDENQYNPILDDIREKFGFPCHIYGSRIMGIASEESDIDIFMDVENSFHETLPDEKIHFYFDLIQRVLSEDLNWTIKNAIIKTRVPVITAFNEQNRMMVDITFSRGMGVANTDLLRHLFSLQPDAAKLCMFVRKWLTRNELNFKNFPVVLLVVFFLQRHRFLPSVHEVLCRERRKIYIDGIEVQFNPNMNVDSYNLRYISNFGALAFEFFDFYSKINFNDALCIQSGSFEPRPNINTRHWRVPMVILGPFSSDKNYAYDIGKKRCNQFKRLCRATANFLQYHV